MRRAGTGNRMERRPRALALLLCAALAVLAAVGPIGSGRRDFGVFTGASAAELPLLRGYDTLVVDAEELSADELAALHAQGNKTVYSYLNIGSVEAYRGCWQTFSEKTLGPYENWPDERWMDVSDPAWAVFLRTAAARLAEKGADGFFLDNADVYDYSRTPAVYSGLLDILRELHGLGKPLILNGGGSFVREALARGELTGLVQGVAQESVFTAVRFPDGVCAAQDADVTAEHTDYLALCRQSGFTVRLIEYAPSARLRRQIDAYCRKNGFAWYSAPSAALDLCA